MTGRRRPLLSQRYHLIKPRFLREQPGQRELPLLSHQDAAYKDREIRFYHPERSSFFIENTSTNTTVPTLQNEVSNFRFSVRYVLNHLASHASRGCAQQRW